MGYIANNQLGHSMLTLIELSNRLFTGYKNQLPGTITHELHHACGGQDNLTDNGLGLSPAQIRLERDKFYQSRLDKYIEINSEFNSVYLKKRTP
ncbi:hypothetical protein [Shewanella halotolerans]|uniref:hypothetical protein n=1 Tax=Shewanella halotolerans TaxID=2864204 RepID=UPI001C658C7D|nr:hypothetical protein [Shewanella halotolerans]QYJ90484.1 hypothetical protein K0H81_02455 [Shewanella halotolerans]